VATYRSGRLFGSRLCLVAPLWSKILQSGSAGTGVVAKPAPVSGIQSRVYCKTVCLCEAQIVKASSHRRRCRSPIDAVHNFITSHYTQSRVEMIGNGFLHSHSLPFPHGQFPFLSIPILNFVTNSHSHGIPTIGYSHSFPFPVPNSRSIVAAYIFCVSKSRLIYNII